MAFPLLHPTSCRVLNVPSDANCHVRCVASLDRIINFYTQHLSVWSKSWDFKKYSSIIICFVQHTVFHFSACFITGSAHAKQPHCHTKQGKRCSVTLQNSETMACKILTFLKLSGILCVQGSTTPPHLCLGTYSPKFIKVKGNRDRARSLGNTCFQQLPISNMHCTVPKDKKK